MITRTLRNIAAMCGGELSSAYDMDKRIAGVVTDSRKITPACLFVPLIGDHFDGHDYSAASLAAGAAATLWQRNKGAAPENGSVILVDDTLSALQKLSSAYLSQIAPQVVAVTGSNGKTTTKDMISALLERQYTVHKTQGNFNNHIGLPLTILSMNEKVQIAVLEMGMSSRGEIALLASLAPPDVAVITNVGESHLLQLGSRKEIARAKLEIAEGLKPGGLLIYNGDEPLLAEVIAEPAFRAPEGMRTFRFGLSSDNADFPTGVMTHMGGMTFTSHLHAEHAFTLPLPGQHNVVNALAALAVARHFSISEDNIEEGLSKLKLTGMRIEMLQAASGLTMLNDAYNASPTSMRAAIDVLQAMKCGGKRIAVLGDMLELGPDEALFHEEIGSYLDPAQTDLVFTFGPLSAHIARKAEERFGPGRVFAFTDKRELTAALTGQIDPRDVVLFKASRGMRLEEVLHSLNDHSQTEPN
ncbi:UDP-N-acetylmuramoyl-tripeptide--D-alanyl-D-alanine ligase [Paenibacillus jilunlii]|uniref:UDP-N-acetylmuramoyl-tripeptide--D-alanyl-D-alanine ligase n=1 Tax=Paenibacillus jilunlii TaxID=682956 RepID=A0A1G9MKY8_9BACL|nr:UDP-N-acetylmuramoyl-tripeptide--D-alanyl-D-alanine ligase [Paenibacillus jilunlii]KWX70445.1 UDP-N-acetylmuramoyl-tripeptide--D-alanyl-D-alanine ligase [Paenibacillus jilunlii]SDL74691.1 UDP-N-acetylmuramoyl-tripeptide--D-alanyl-D-alanine ligase [Paenibacillus jilunlii]